MLFTLASNKEMMSFQRASVKNKETVTGRTKHSSPGWSAGKGQPVNHQSCPFKCELSWKQVQKWWLWTVAELPGSRLATLKCDSVALCSFECFNWIELLGVEELKSSRETSWCYYSHFWHLSWKISGKPCRSIRITLNFDISHSCP